MKSLFFIFSTFSLFSCATNPVSIALIKSTTYNLVNPPIVGTTTSEQKILLGGFSGLTFIRSENNEYIFKTITDRGANGWQVNENRPFLLPEYSPEIITIKTNTANKEISVLEELKLKKSNGTPLSGLPNNRLEENPIDIFGFIYSVDKEGLDTEALVSDDEEGYWVGEEYAPSLVHFDKSGKLLKRLMPGNELPRIYAERKSNRGFEGIAKNKNKIFGILQSPIPVDKTFNRIVEFDLDTYKTSAEYFYSLDPSSDRVGDMVALNDNSFLVIEQNGKAADKSYKKIYRITLNKSDEQVTKTLILDLDQTSFKEHEKVEGLTIIDGHHIALVNDNDFGITAETNFKNGITPLGNSATQLIIIELGQSLF